MTKQDRIDLERFVVHYNEFCSYEYGSEPITTDEAIAENTLGILYTTSVYDEEYNLDDDACEFQVEYNLKELSLKYWVDTHLVLTENFKTIGELADDFEGSQFESFYDVISDEFYKLLRSGKIRVENGEAVWL